MNSGTNSMYLGNVSNIGLNSGTSLKVYPHRQNVTYIDRSNLSNKTNRLTLYKQIQNDIEVLNDKMRLISQLIKTYDSYDSIVNQFYEKFNAYMAPEINEDKKIRYEEYLGNLFNWYEDTYIFYDKDTKTLNIV